MKRRRLTHREKSIESMATHEELRAKVEGWSKNTGRYWRRRWRVEGGRGGNSYLLDRKRAEATAQKYGGRVVQVILPRQPKGM